MTTGQVYAELRIDGPDITDPTERERVHAQLASEGGCCCEPDCWEPCACGSVCSYHARHHGECEGDDGRVRMCQPSEPVSRLTNELAALEVGDMYVIGEPPANGAVTVVRVTDGYVLTDLTSGSATVTDRLRLVRPADSGDATLTGSAWGGNPRDGLLIPGWMTITGEHGDVVLWDSGACGESSGDQT